MKPAKTAAKSMTRMTAAPAAPSGRRRAKVRETASQRGKAGDEAPMLKSLAMAGDCHFLLIPDARVEPGVHQVDDEIDEDEDERREQHQALHHGVIALADRLDEQLADSVQVEHLLGDDQAADEK